MRKEKKITKKSILFMLFVFMFSVVLVGAKFSAVGASEKGTIKLGWTSWVEDEAGMQVAKYILENKMGYKVEPILGDMGVIAAGLKKGDIDVFLEFCLPSCHKDYWSNIAQDTVIAGTFYHPTTQAWAIPDYIPKDKLNTIDDLKKPDVREKLDGKIIGIEPGAGLMRRSKRMIKIYGLDYELVSGSEPAMLAALKKAVKNKDWIVVTLWVPHFAYAQWPLRNLVETKEKIVGALDSCHVITRSGFGSDYPDVFRFFSRFNWNVAEINKLIYQTGVEKKPVEEAAKEFVESHQKLVEYWITGELKN